MYKCILFRHPGKVFKCQVGNAYLCFKGVDMPTKLRNGIKWSVELKQQTTYLKTVHSNV